MEPTSNPVLDESSTFAGVAKDDDIVIDHPMQLDSAGKVCNFYYQLSFC